MSVTAMVRRPSPPRNTSGQAAPFRRRRRLACRQKSGLLDAALDPHRGEARSTPRRKTARHPQRASRPATTGPPARTEAQALCMNPSALPRGSADHVSDTSAAPSPTRRPCQARDKNPEDRKLGHGLPRTAGGVKTELDQDARDERARPAVGIRDHAKDETADGRGHQRGRSSRPAVSLPMPRSLMRRPTRGRHITSKLSSIHPGRRPSARRRPSGVPGSTRHQP